MNSHDEIAPPQRGKTPLTSQKLNRTLKELESAFNEWEALGVSIAQKAGNAGSESESATGSNRSSANSGGPGSAADGSEKEFRTKTKKLLNQLREQLNELDE
jgi:hypothetical protein